MKSLFLALGGGGGGGDVTHVRVLDSPEIYMYTVTMSNNTLIGPWLQTISIHVFYVLAKRRFDWSLSFWKNGQCRAAISSSVNVLFQVQC